MNGTIQVYSRMVPSPQTLASVELEFSAMDHFPMTWLPIIGKHLRKHLELPSDTPLPESVQRALAQLRLDEIARLNTCGGN
jgi:hypothetical protein